MNKERRTRITALQDKLREISSEIETIKDEEQEYYDNMPESLQGGDKGQAAEAAINALDEAYNEVEHAADNLDEAISG